MGVPIAMTLLVRDPLPLGEVTLVPKALSGRSEAEMAHAMAAAVADAEFASAADALRHLRQAFPQAPLGTARRGRQRPDASASAGHSRGKVTSRDRPAARGRRRAAPRPRPRA